MINDLNDILKVQFSPTLKGYNPLEVDNCLDAIYDYAFNLNSKLKNALNELSKMNHQLDSAYKRIQDLEIEISSLKGRLAQMEGLGNGDTKGNLDYLKRINQLEVALHKLGIDPNSIK